MHGIDPVSQVSCISLLVSFAKEGVELFLSEKQLSW